MPWTAHAKVREFSRRVGWTFHIQYVFTGDFWSARFYDARGQVVTQSTHRRIFQAMENAVSQAKIIYDLQERQMQRGNLND